MRAEGSWAAFEPFPKLQFSWSTAPGSKGCHCSTHMQEARAEKGQQDDFQPCAAVLHRRQQQAGWRRHREAGNECSCLPAIWAGQVYQWLPLWQGSRQKQLKVIYWLTLGRSCPSRETDTAAGAWGGAAHCVHRDRRCCSARFLLFTSPPSYSVLHTAKGTLPSSVEPL